MTAPRRRTGLSSGAARWRPLARGALCLALASTLAACWPGDGSPRPTPASTSASTRPASPAAQPVAGPADLAEAARTDGTSIGSGGLTLTIAAHTMPVTVESQDDGSVVLTVTGGDSGASSQVWAVLAAPSDRHFRVEPDGSVTVLAGTGAVVGALSRVEVADGAGARLGARLAVQDADATLLDVLVDAAPAGSATLTFGATPLVSATWGEREGGRSLAVVPAAWVRSGGLAAQDALWSAVVAAEPDADSTTMRDQLMCHALGAPTKAAWNIEPWRPQVDGISLVAARCNP